MVKARPVLVQLLLGTILNPSHSLQVSYSKEIVTSYPDMICKIYVGVLLNACMYRTMCLF